MEQHSTFDLTTEQRHAISRQARFYDTDECPVRGLVSHRVYDARASWGDSFPEGAAAVDFTYEYEDGAYGLETTVFDRVGAVLTSQDFG